MGIDSQGGPEQPIFAIAAGRVVNGTWGTSGNDGHGWGNYARIDHGNGIHSLYAHFNRAPFVGRGRSVQRGQQIGVMGGSGFGRLDYYPRHLHLEIFRNNANINPLEYLEQGNPDTPPPARQFWKDSTMRLIRSSNGPIWLVGPGGSVHITSQDDLKLLQRVLNSDPAAYDTFTPEQTATIDRYMKNLVGRPINGVTVLKTSDGKAFLAGPGGTVHILNPNHLDIMLRYLRSGTYSVLTFTPSEKDIIDGYLVKLVGK